MTSMFRCFLDVDYSVIEFSFYIQIVHTGLPSLPARRNQSCTVQEEHATHDWGLLPWRHCIQSQVTTDQYNVLARCTSCYKYAQNVKGKFHETKV